jgi:chromosome segregation ATPase
VRIQAAQDLEQVRTQSSAAETRIKRQNDRDVDTVASIQALRQEIDSNQKALSEKEQLLHMSHSQCRTLEDAIEDRDKEIDHLRRKLESFLRKTGGLGEISEMLNSSMTELSHRLFEESERLTSQHKGQLSKELKDNSVDNQRTSLGRLFRKR